VTHLDRSRSELRHILPFVLPDGKAMLYTVQSTSAFNWEQTSIVAQLLTTGERRTLLQGGADARYVSGGHLVYLKTGTLMSVPFDAQKLELRGSPVAVLDNVMQAIGAPSALDDTGAGQFDVSANGSLVFVSGGVYPPRRNDLVWVDRAGAVTPLPLPAGGHVAPRVSPNGELIAFFSRRPSSRESDIWVYNIGRQNATRLTFQDTNDWVVWSPDSKKLVFHMADAADLGRVSADGGTPERLMVGDAGFPASWSNTGNVLALLQRFREIWILPMDGKGKPTLFLQASSFNLSYPDFSPDGRWLAYVSPETGGNEVYVQPYPGPGGKTRISTNGGDSPAWAHNGRELFFLEGSTDMGRRLMVSDIDASNGFHAGKPRPLFEWAYSASSPFRGYDIAPDDRRFITSRTVGTPEPPFTQMHIILNWTEELKSRVPK
jgi:serine/threonine-protein kinase